MKENLRAGEQSNSGPVGQPSVPRKGKGQGYILLTVLSIIWGLAFVGIRRADFELSAVNLTVLRWLIASAGFLAIWPFVGKPKVPFERKDAPRLIVVALFNVSIYHLSLNYAEKIVSSSLAGLLISLGPVFVVVLSVISLHEKVGAKLVLALALAVTGASVLSLGDFNLTFTDLSGPLAVVVTSFAYGVYAVSSKPLVSKYGPFPTVIWASCLGTVFLLPLVSGSLITQVSSLSLYGWLSVLFLALLSTVLANSIFYALVSGRTVSRLSIQLYIIPLVSVAGGVLLLQEAISVFTVLGGVILLTGVALATTK
ncbi:MAG: DMT family transporter [Thaumarchaeota archaeon]|nr:DMT family transporter [Nitrososphaerota archaeon]